MIDINAAVSCWLNTHCFDLSPHIRNSGIFFICGLRARLLMSLLVNIQGILSGNDSPLLLVLFNKCNKIVLNSLSFCGSPLTHRKTDRLAV